MLLCLLAFDTADARCRHALRDRRGLRYSAIKAMRYCRDDAMMMIMPLAGADYFYTRCHYNIFRQDAITVITPCLCYAAILISRLRCRYVSDASP